MVLCQVSGGIFRANPARRVLFVIYADPACVVRVIARVASHHRPDGPAHPIAPHYFDGRRPRTHRNSMNNSLWHLDLRPRQRGPAGCNLRRSFRARVSTVGDDGSKRSWPTDARGLRVVVRCRRLGAGALVRHIARLLAAAPPSRARLGHPSQTHCKKCSVRCLRKPRSTGALAHARG